jgi:hypothetical protein
MRRGRRVEVEHACVVRFFWRLERRAVRSDAIDERGMAERDHRGDGAAEALA